MMRLLSILAALVVSAPAAFGHPPVGIAFYDVDRLYDRSEERRVGKECR